MRENVNDTVDRLADALVASLSFWFAAHVVIHSEALLAEAARCERYNPPWARNRRREAGRLLTVARQWCGEGGLPWGVQVAGGGG